MAIENNDMDNFDIFQSLRWVCSVWENEITTTIRNCFKKAEFIKKIPSDTYIETTDDHPETSTSAASSDHDYGNIFFND